MVVERSGGGLTPVGGLHRRAGRAVTCPARPMLAVDLAGGDDVFTSAA